MLDTRTRLCSLWILMVGGALYLCMQLLHNVECSCAGFATPGPSYRPASVRGPEYSCGTSTMKKEEGVTVGPGRIGFYVNITDILLWPPLTAGPAVYTLPIPIPPSPYCGERLSVDWDPHYPAPNAYSIPGLVGSGPAKSFGIKAERQNG